MCQLRTKRSAPGRPSTAPEPSRARTNRRRIPPALPGRRRPQSEILPPHSSPVPSLLSIRGGQPPEIHGGFMYRQPTGTAHPSIPPPTHRTACNSPTSKDEPTKSPSPPAKQQPLRQPSHPANVPTTQGERAIPFNVRPRLGKTALAVAPSFGLRRISRVVCRQRASSASLNHPPKSQHDNPTPTSSANFIPPERTKRRHTAKSSRILRLSWSRGSVLGLS